MGDIEIPSIFTELIQYPVSGLMVKVLLAPEFNEIAPDGEIYPPVPALAVMVYVLRLKAAETVVLLFMTTVHLFAWGPELPPDQPAKVEFESGVAVSVTIVPLVKVVPEGLVVTVPPPFPVLVMVSVNVGEGVVVGGRTVSVTGIVWGEFVAPGALIVIVAV
jgi:hypothetical protein